MSAECHKRTFASGRETIKFEVSLFACYGNYADYKQVFLLYRVRAIAKIS